MTAGLAEVAARSIVELGILTALVAFLSKRWADRYAAALNAKHQRELQQLKAGLDAAVHVSAAQFEAEFTAIRSIWAQVHQLRRAFLKACIASARETEDEPEDKMARDEWLKDRLNVMIHARNELADTLHSHEPFITNRAYEALIRLVDAADHYRRVAWRDQFSAEWFDQNDRLRDAFVANCEAAKTEVRKRFAALRLPGEKADATESADDGIALE